MDIPIDVWHMVQVMRRDFIRCKYPSRSPKLDQRNANDGGSLWASWNELTRDSWFLISDWISRRLPLFLEGDGISRQLHWNVQRWGIVWKNYSKHSITVTTSTRTDQLCAFYWEPPELCCCSTAHWIMIFILLFDVHSIFCSFNFFRASF